MTQTCFQVNLQPGWGGGEVYTVFFTRALAALGIRTVLFSAAVTAARWRRQLPDETEVVAVASDDELAAAMGAWIPRDGHAWVIFHTPVLADRIVPLRTAGHLVSCFAHMPLYGRDPAPLRPYDLVVPVSRHVLGSLRAAGIAGAYDEPLYGIADLSARSAGQSPRRQSCYDWDRRKLRDRLLGAIEPLVERLRPHPPFRRSDGIALGIVSRLTPIKQFPVLFTHLAPVLARHSAFCLEVFGSGGYASVRDLRRALAPIRHRVRFWGQQEDVIAVYRQLDYLLTGLPEKEALGLNIIEAQACGLPVLAVDAPPFTETVASEVTGLFYADPRADDGAGFERLLTRLEENPFRPNPVAASVHLQQFSEAAFIERVRRLAARIEALTGPGR